MSTTTFRVKRSSVEGKTPTTGQLELGEIAVNTFDGRMFIKKDDGAESVIQVGGITSTSFDSATKEFTLTTSDSSFSTLLDFAQQSDISTAITNLINGAPDQLNTLGEIAAAINNDSAFSTTINNQITANRINVYNASGTLLN